MPQVSFKIKYKKNEGLIISPEELLALYFYGINITANDGTEMDLETVKFYIKSAQKELESYVQIKLFPTLVSETLGYYRKDYFGTYPSFQTKYPVKQAYTLIGLLNNSAQIIYPSAWFKTHRDDPDGDYAKYVTLVPSGLGAGTATGNAEVILTGVSGQYGFQRHYMIPEYWDMQYLTGYSYDNLPYDIVNVVGKWASIGIFAILGDLIIGAGIASLNLSIDGLSEGISTTSSATNSGFGARIIQYQKEVKETLNRIKGRYRGINLVSM